MNKRQRKKDNKKLMNKSIFEYAATVARMYGFGAFGINTITKKSHFNRQIGFYSKFKAYKDGLK